MARQSIGKTLTTTKDDADYLEDTATMDLRTFISTALLDILGGVKDAQGNTTEGTIVPEANQASVFIELGVTPVQVVDFEVSVRVEASKGRDGKLGVVNALINAGMAGKSSHAVEHASIIKFKVPLKFPTSGPSRKKRGATNSE